MKCVARGFVVQERPSVFGGEDQMNVNGGKGLWHGVRMPNGNGSPAGIGVQSRRIASISPRSSVRTFVRYVYSRSSISTHTPAGKKEVLRIRDWVRVVLAELLELR